jgi:hypothetical protein
MALIILGGFLSFYVVGLFLIPLGVWLWARKRRLPARVPEASG